MQSNKTEEQEAYYRLSSLVKNKGYKLCEEWKDRFAFEEWYRKNKITLPNEQVQFTAKLFVNDDKTLSSESVFFVPYTIKMALRDNFGENKNSLSQGIKYIPSTKNDGTGKYSIVFSCKKLGGKGSIGVADTLEEAKIVYKEIKEQCIHILADMYKDVISESLYRKLKDYEYNEVK